MASTTYTTSAKSGFASTAVAFGKSFARAGTHILEMMSSAMEAHPRMRRVQELQSMSDERLAQLGLKREDIVRHVFRDFV